MDASSKHQKDKGWLDLVNEFNSQQRTARTDKMLRSKWEALKKETKHEYNKIKNYNSGTGGGPCKQKNP